MSNESVILKNSGPCVILAGAGTGKTYTVIEKLKNIIKNKVYSPEKIVCITFSNEAANNLTSRLEKHFDFESGKGPIIKTFHSFSADLLRQFGESIGLKKDFKILDPDQAKIVLYRNLRVEVSNCHRYISSIGIAKDLGITIEDYVQFMEKEFSDLKEIIIEKRLESLQFELQTMHLSSDKLSRENKKKIVEEITRINNYKALDKFVKLWRGYEKLKEKLNYLDYSDLNVKALELLNVNKEISNNFDYFIVDEFQDTNKIQLDIIFGLCKNRNITVVGDLNQSIYRFRGAYKDNFNLFKEHFNVSNSEVFTLAKSFRSPNTVLRAAHKLISNNYKNKEECFFVENAKGIEGNKVEVHELKDSKEEARKVVEIIKQELKNGRELEDICVMFRTHQQGRLIRKALDFAGIEYSAVSKSSLLKQKSIKTVIDYLIILNKLKKKEKGGEQAWWDLIYHLDFLEGDLVKVGNFLKENRDVENLSAFMLANLESLNLSSSGKLASKILIEKIKSLIQESEKEVHELINLIFSVAGLINDGRTKKEKEIMLNLNKFYELAKAHSDIYSQDLESFVHYLEIVDNLNIEIEAAEVESNGVRLMTSHSTKGLEYKVVILTNMVQKKFPIERYTGNSLIPVQLMPEIKNDIKGMNKEEIEIFVKEYERYNQLFEERRLCYVSFTRAREKLIMTYANDYAGKKFLPSQFLQEIDYKKNNDMEFSIDKEVRYEEPEVRIHTAADISGILGKQNFDEAIVELLKRSDRKGFTEGKEHKSFSPSALLLFSECQKKFEYKYVYHMPDKKTLSWEEMRLGSFVHLILENGVKSKFKDLKDFLNLARETSRENEWEGLNLEQAELLIKVFYERNKGKYNEKSETEKALYCEIAGMRFAGYADRIDFNDDGITIVDYKTGKSTISPKHRNWQLGYYAIAARQFGKVKRVILDMLKQEKPIEFEFDEKGNAFAVNSDRMQGFNIYEVEEELIKAAHAIQDAYKQGFKPCSIESNCDFCNEYVYGL